MVVNDEALLVELKKLMGREIQKILLSGKLVERVNTVLMLRLERVDQAGILSVQQ